MKLLIVDDSQFIRNTIKIKVNDLDIDLYEASDSDSAIKTYKEVMPDLVFMDIMMKKEDGGLIAIKEILKVDPKSKIVVITSLGESDPFVTEAIELGVLDVITKPFNKEELYRYLDPTYQFKSRFD